MCRSLVSEPLFTSGSGPNLERPWEQNEYGLTRRQSINWDRNTLKVGYGPRT